MMFTLQSHPPVKYTSPYLLGQCSVLPNDVALASLLCHWTGLGRLSQRGCVSKRAQVGVNAALECVPINMSTAGKNGSFLIYFDETASFTKRALANSSSDTVCCKHTFQCFKGFDTPKGLFHCHFWILHIHYQLCAMPRKAAPEMDLLLCRSKSGAAHP